MVGVKSPRRGKLDSLHGNQPVHFGEVWTLSDYLLRDYLPCLGELGAISPPQIPLITQPLPVYPNARELTPSKESQLHDTADLTSTKCGICPEIYFHPLTNLLAFQGSTMAQRPTSFFIPPSLGRIPLNHSWPSRSWSPCPMKVWWSALLKADKGGLGCGRDRKQHPAGGPSH